MASNKEEVQVLIVVYEVQTVVYYTFWLWVQLHSTFTDVEGTRHVVQKFTLAK
jgi:hypothetical protein